MIDQHDLFLFNIKSQSSYHMFWSKINLYEISSIFIFSYSKINNAMGLSFYCQQTILPVLLFIWTTQKLKVTNHLIHMILLRKFAAYILFALFLFGVLGCLPVLPSWKQLCTVCRAAYQHRCRLCLWHRLLIQ